MTYTKSRHDGLSDKEQEIVDQLESSGYIECSETDAYLYWYWVGDIPTEYDSPKEAVTAAYDQWNGVPSAMFPDAKVGWSDVWYEQPSENFYLASVTAWREAWHDENVEWPSSDDFTTLLDTNHIHYQTATSEENEKNTFDYFRAFGIFVRDMDIPQLNEMLANAKTQETK